MSLRTCAGTFPSFLLSVGHWGGGRKEKSEKCICNVHTYKRRQKRALNVRVYGVPRTELPFRSPIALILYTRTIPENVLLYEPSSSENEHILAYITYFYFPINYNNKTHTPPRNNILVSSVIRFLTKTIIERNYFRFATHFDYDKILSPSLYIIRIHRYGNRNSINPTNLPFFLLQYSFFFYHRHILRLYNFVRVDTK